MNKLYFITSNQGKIKTLKTIFSKLGLNIDVEGINLDIIEPQADTVKEVSLIKAKKAFEILQQPVLVEDGGFEIDSLNGFPGVYTKFILNTIGANGLLDLMHNKTNRKARFVSCSTFINQNGEVYHFDRQGGEGLISLEKSEKESEVAWSEIWHIFYVKELNKILSECSKEEVSQWYSLSNQKQSLILFAEWLKNKDQQQKDT